MSSARLHFVLAATLLSTSVTQARAQVTATVQGVIRDQSGPIAGARIDLAGTRFAVVSRPDGRFTLGTVPAGRYALRIMKLGYRPHERPLVIADTTVEAIDVVLESAPVPLAAVVVTPGYFGIMQPSVATPHTLTRQDIETVPQLAEDIYRAITRLPGVGADDFSARFSVRGADGTALYSTLDGLALTEPFHLKDIGGSTSIIDMQALAGAELTTGGPGVEYGDQLAGVFAMHSLAPRTDRARTSLSLSILNARVMSDGGFAGGKGGWLVSARRGYIDLALKLTSAGDSMQPRYYDVFAKTQYDLGRYGRFALHTLLSGDKLEYQDGPDEGINSSYNSRYAWATWSATIGERLTQQTIASIGGLDWSRKGRKLLRDGSQYANLDDGRSATVSTLRQDWTLETGARFMSKAGFEVGRQTAKYDYSNWLRVSYMDTNRQLATRVDSTEVLFSPSTNRAAAYVAERVRIADPLTIEAGVRFDAGEYGYASRISPRLNAAWEPRAGTAVRGAWGSHVQSEPLFAVQVENGDRTFHDAERAEQRVIGLEQALPRRFSARIEAYQRIVSNPRPRWVNVSGSIEMQPELNWDRVLIAPSAARAKGIEAFLGREGQLFDWSMNYVLSSSEIRLGAGYVRAPMDQRHAIRTDWSVHPASNRWRLAIAVQRHSGWPTTPAIVTIDTLVNTPTQFSLFAQWQPGAYNTDELPAYNRVDARWTRFFETKRGRIAFFAEVFNLLDTQNLRGYFSEIRVSNNRQVSIVRDTQGMIPRLPSIGLSWEF